MSAEGWNGKNIRQHVEQAKADAARAVEIAEGLEARVDELTAQTRLSAPNGHTNAPPSVTTRPAALEAYRPALFRRVEVVREEIKFWQLFRMEARAVRQAIDEWRQLDTETCAPRPRGSENE